MQIDAPAGKELPKGQKWFLLSKLFGLLPSEIARMEGLHGSSSVRELIIRVSDQLRCGEIRLFDATPEEAEQETNGSATVVIVSSARWFLQNVNAISIIICVR